MSRKRPDLSKTEWSIMNICWRQGRSSARIVYEETLKEKSRGYQTVKTMLDRLVEKGYLRREKFGPIWLYEPTVSRSAVLAREIESFVATVLDNTLAPIFVHFAKKETLSDEELDELRKLIEKKEEERNDTA
ncbi:MAG: BlaI/MecI/CopY family transcriptional regulator [Candidatus Latescibacterota bacterium]